MQPGQHITSTLRLERLLGKGGMGSVWAADHLALATQVAVKFMSASYVENQSLVARFRTEAMAAAQIKSPHVAQVFDHGIMNDGTPFIVMELLEGEDLKRRIRREGPLPLRDVAQIIAQACKALGRAHQLGIVHRDIKPDNLFLCNMDGETFVKVLDFGIAKLGPDNALGATTTGSMMGTPLYMSPEQLLSAKRVDYRSDLWSLAVVAYHALTGRVPFNGETVGSLSVAVHGGAYAPPSALRQGLPPGVDAWFQRALRRDPNERFATAKELAETLDQALSGSVMGPNPMRGYQDSAVYHQGYLAPPPPSGPSSMSAGALAHTPQPGISSPNMQGPTLAGTSTTAARTGNGKPAMLIGAVATVLVLGAIAAVAIVRAGGSKETTEPPAAAAAAPPTESPKPPAPVVAPAPTPVVEPVAAAPTSTPSPAPSAAPTTTPVKASTGTRPRAAARARRKPRRRSRRRRGRGGTTSASERSSMRSRRTRHGVSTLLVAVGLCLAGPALGQQPQPSASAKNTARTLLVDGRAKFAAGDYPGALKAFQGAHAIMGVPTTGLDLARAQAKMGQLTEARETAAEVVRFDSAGNQAFVSAQQDAATLAQELDARIPSLVLNVNGAPSGAALEVTVDGEVVPPAVLTLPRKVNPGEHTVLARSPGFADAQRTVNIAEKETKYVEVTLSRPGGSSAGGAEVVPYAPGDEGARGGIPTWAWVAGGVGLASVGASIAFGVDFGDAQDDVAAACPDNRCKELTTEDAAALQARWNRSLALTVVFATVGAAGLGAATYGIVTARPKEKAAAVVVPWVGPGSGGVVAVGRF